MATSSATSVELTLLATLGAVLGPGLSRSRIGNFVSSIQVAAQAYTSTWTMGKIPAGVVPLFGYLAATVSLGSTTVAVGITGTLGKYRAAATNTVVDTPVFFANHLLGVAATGWEGVRLSAEETILVTGAAADWPAATETFVLGMFWLTP